mmetsp:Transcript_60115/g.178238  ORF Transcript_60115/g.178238 Transcript_60115/m.178238 type:complete len:426 (-) Transcript_60115:79-1356(-)
MSTGERRIINALKGAFVADAACMGTNWIYNPEEMKLAVKSDLAPEFSNPASRYYSSDEFPNHYRKGMLSPHGEYLLFFTQYLSKRGETSSAKQMHNALKVWAETPEGCPPHQEIQNFRTQRGAGENERGPFGDQVHCFIKVIPLTCLFAGKLERRTKVEDVLRIDQENDADQQRCTDVAFGLALSDILDALILGQPLDQALASGLERNNESREVSSAFAYARRMADESNTLNSTAAVRGRSCHLPEAFVIPIQACLAALVSPSASRYEEAVRDNILASGDTCIRGMVIGAVLGAAFGGPPNYWIESVDLSQFSKANAAASAISSFFVGASFSGPNGKSQDLINAAMHLRAFVEVKDRTWRLKKYRQCFTGSEAVDFLVGKDFATSRKAAVEMGKKMQTRLNLFDHVVGEHEFEDAYLFYRFKEYY